jgi:hypothetical protein
MSFCRVVFVAWLVSALCLFAQPELTASAQAQREIYVFPSKGTVGDMVRVAGEGFNKSTADSDKFAAVFFSSQEATTDDDIDVDVTRYELVAEGVLLSEKGEFDISFEVPDELNDGDNDEKIHDGLYYVYVCHYMGNVLAPRIRAVAEFDVILGDIVIEPDEGVVGTSVEITGTTFFPDEDIAIYYDGIDMTIDRGDTETDGSGEFTAYVTIPKSTTGKHKIAVIQDENAVSAEFTVKPDVTVNPTSGVPGTLVTILGDGFDRKESITIYFDIAEVASIDTDSVGDFVTTFNIPELAAGLYEIQVDDGEKVQIAKFSIISPSKPSPSPPPPEPPQMPAVIEINRLAGNVGAEVVASGTGFLQSGTVTVEYDGELLASVAIDAEGKFQLSFQVPVGEHGDHLMVISDGLNTKELTFTVESEAPAAPELLLGTPIVVKEGDELLLDWEDVVDKSMPVSYTLQLAQDAGFATGSVFLEKTELADSEYLIEASTMKQLRPRRSYYWRVRAVDSASNIGGWTKASEIKIAPASTMPSWLMYMLAVLGALFILFIWYMIRRAERKTG